MASRGLDAVHIIGGGLAGCEAAWQLLSRGVPVVLYEMRGTRSTQAHVTEDLAELVCSNSFRSDDVETAVGLLHAEMRIASSLILEAADATRVPSGSALAVDRVGFAKYVMGKLLSHPFFTLKREEVTQIPEGRVIVATGPLTSDDFASQLLRVTQEGYLAFFDAIAPIVHKDSIDFSKSWFQSRYDKGEGFDYINCPLDKEQYESFITLLLDGEKIEFKEWEKTTPYFNGCLPIEVIAFRGRESLRFGPMKPVGLTDPNTGKRPYAVVQLRQDNKIGTLYNIVGFQTKLKYSDQVRIFRTIPGLEKAEFARLGGLHRNTFINSPKLLEANLSLKSAHDIKVAGQITGVEGYLESAAIGLLAGLFTNFELRGEPLIFPPKDTALGALLRHITTNAHSETFQPMNINYGLFEELDGVSRQANKKQLYSNRALAQAKAWVINLNDKLGESYV